MDGQRSRNHTAAAIPPPPPNPKPSLESFKEYMCPYKKAISMICVSFIPV